MDSKIVNSEEKSNTENPQVPATTNGNGSNVPVISKQETVRNLLDKYKEQLAMALPKHISAGHFIRTALTCINKTPKLLECTTPSLMGALLQSAQLGLSPDGYLGEAYLIPFKNSKKQADGTWKSVMEVQFIPGYRGLIQLAQRSGVVKSFQAREVYANDEFNYEFGLEPKLTHVPCKTGERGELAYVYAVCHFTNGGYVFEVMTLTEVNFIRTKSKAPDSPAWKEFYPEMAKKSVIRKLAKICPLSPEFNTAVGLDDHAELLGSQKNDREIMNYNFDQPLKDEVTEAITEDITAEGVEVEEAKQEAKEDVVTGAVQTSLDMIEKKKKDTKQQTFKDPR